MSTSSIQSNILYGLGEGVNVADSISLTYALRWANAAYRELFLRYQFKCLQTRSVFRTSNGQQTYQAPSDFAGFLVLKDESNDEIIEQVTPEEFARDVSPKSVSDETFTSDADVAVSLDQQAILQYSETVTTTDGATTYTRDTDYTMSYASGTITVDSTGSMSDATDYYIDYLYYETGKPSQFCLEYDATNAKYVFRLDPVPDDTYIGSLLYPAIPSDLSGSVDAVWSKFEFALERGGIYYGSLELYQEQQQIRNEFKGIYETAMQALIQTDQDMIPKRQRIPVVMRKTDYT